jgi:heme oxygenase-like protein
MTIQTSPGPATTGAGAPAVSEPPAAQPLLAFPAVLSAGEVVIDRAGAEYAIAIEGVPPQRLLTLLNHIDGTRTVGELAAETGDPELVAATVAELDRHLLLDDATPPRSRSGLDVLLELEDLANDLHERIMYNNVYWAALRDPSPGLPHNVMYGFCIENYHFLFRESYFDSPVLSYQPSTRVRLIMNEFYREEYGHDEIILRSLNSIGISRDDLADTMPLPQTMAMCNALSWWATTDPVFFFTTLGVLEGKDIREGEQDFFLDACDALRMDQAFVKPMRTHANINRDSEHGNLTRAIFREIPCLDEATVRRLRAQTHLFFGLYDAFFAGIWDFYSTSPDLLRRVSAL